MSEHEPKNEKSQEEIVRLAMIEIGSARSFADTLGTSVSMVEQELQDADPSLLAQQRAHEHIKDALRMLQTVHESLVRFEEHRTKIEDTAVAQSLQLESEEIQKKLITYGDRLSAVRGNIPG